MLPHLRDRPFTLQRYPYGSSGPSTWIKDVPPEAPDWIRVAALPARSRGGAPVRYPLVQNGRTLLWFVDFGALDLHVASARVDKPERPDWALFDLDPKGGDPTEAALVLHEALNGLSLESCASAPAVHDGVHVLVPLARVHDYDEVRSFVNWVARAVHRTRPRLGVSIDVKMNGRAQQFVSAYSVRPKTARVCTPVTWNEIEARLDPASLTMDEVLRRVEQLGDLHALLLKGRQRLGPTLDRFARAMR